MHFHKADCADEQASDLGQRMNEECRYMDVLTAAQNVVEDFPGGARALGPLIGKGGSTLAHEIDRNYEGSKLGLHDAVKITRRTGDDRILQAFAMECGYYVSQIPEIGERSDVVGAFVNHSLGHGQFVVAASEAVRDGLVTDNELELCRRRAGEAIAELTALLRLIEAANARTRLRASTLERVA